MQGSRFHAAAAPDEADLRSTADVFKSAAGQSEGFKARFETAGKFTSEQLDAGDDVNSAAAPEAAEPGTMRAPRTHTHAASPDRLCVCARSADPADQRSLYDRLKEQKDAKQEEWEHKHAFKNQVPTPASEHRRCA